MSAGTGPAQPGRSTRRWQPTLGAWHDGDGTRFRVWAPEQQQVEVVIEADGSRPGLAQALEPRPGGYFEAQVRGVTAGRRYRYRFDGQGPFPDPASRFQPEGVHGPSLIVNPAAYTWSDAAWGGPDEAPLVLYELHVGTFTPEGTFAAAASRLPDLRALGVTAVELMPVAAFPGARNWGYDGVALFAPSERYGRPDDLRGLVDRAHALGLAVFLDVVYNHVGPDGAYLYAFSPWYFTDDHPSPWGASANLDGRHAADARRFFIENALHWVHEYHLDGLRLDATHAMYDDGPVHFLAELAERVHVTAGARVKVIAEDHRNLDTIVRPVSEGGWGLDGVWADDLHHQLRVALAGDSDGYYMDYTGRTADIAATLERGWFFTGAHSRYLDEPRGTDPAGLPPSAFVVCIQNHDQVGNRALGDRLHHQIDLAAYRAASALLLTAPQTPLLFMGQEWGSTAPFLYFTDHHEELGRLVTEGRRREFARFAAFASPDARARIPDPQAPSTFEGSRLDWSERARQPHASLLRLYQALLALRREAPALGAGGGSPPARAQAIDDDVLMFTRQAGSQSLSVVVRLRGRGTVAIDAPRPGVRMHRVALSTEDPAFAADPSPIDVAATSSGMLVTWSRPGAIVLEWA